MGGGRVESPLIYQAWLSRVRRVTSLRGMGLLDAREDEFHLPAALVPMIAPGTGLVQIVSRIGFAPRLGLRSGGRLQYAQHEPKLIDQRGILARDAVHREPQGSQHLRC